MCPCMPTDINLSFDPYSNYRSVWDVRLHPQIQPVRYGMLRLL